MDCASEKDKSVVPCNVQKDCQCSQSKGQLDRQFFNWVHERINGEIKAAHNVECFGHFVFYGNDAIMSVQTFKTMRFDK